MLANSFGTGMVMPFVLIYLHDVRGFAFATAGFVAATFGAVSMLATPVAGSLLDRRGSRAIFVGSLLVLAAGYGLFSVARQPWQACLCLALAGIGNGAVWPAQSILLLGLVPASRRHAAFAMNRAVGNLGIGLGAVTGGLIATTGDPRSFTTLLLVDAATFVVCASSALLVPRPATLEAAAGGARGSYLDVLRNRTFLILLALNTIFVTAGLAQLEAGLPIFAKHHAGASEAVIGFVFLANVLGVVVAQMPISRLLQGRSRMRSLALAAVLWGAALLLAELAAIPGGSIAVVVLIAGGALFAIGECLHAPIVSPLTADLAPDALRGRYMALVTNSFAIGFTVGPALAGAILGVAPFALLPLAAAACIAGGGLAIALERRLPDQARLTPA